VGRHHRPFARLDFFPGGVVKPSLALLRMSHGFFEKKMEFLMCPHTPFVFENRPSCPSLPGPTRLITRTCLSQIFKSISPPHSFCMHGWGAQLSWTRLGCRSVRKQLILTRPFTLLPDAVCETRLPCALAGHRFSPYVLGITLIPLPELGLFLVRNKRQPSAHPPVFI